MTNASRFRTLVIAAMWLPACIPDAPKLGMKDNAGMKEGAGGTKSLADAGADDDDDDDDERKSQGGAAAKAAPVDPPADAGRGMPSGGSKGNEGNPESSSKPEMMPMMPMMPMMRMVAVDAGVSDAGETTDECFIAFANNECGACSSLNCDASCVDCGADRMCRDAFNCILHCTTNDERCLNGCFQRADARAQQRLGSLVQCFDGCSRACGKRNVGDPCTSMDQCSGACVANACTNVCDTDADCGATSEGRANLCLDSTDGRRICYPSCSSNADCAKIPGRVCFHGGTWSVCASAPSMSEMSAGCVECVDAQCAAEINACLADAGCDAYLRCTCSLGDAACEQACVDALPQASAPLVQQLSACIELRCDSCE